MVNPILRNPANNYPLSVERSTLPGHELIISKKTDNDIMIGVIKENTNAKNISTSFKLSEKKQFINRYIFNISGLKLNPTVVEKFLKAPIVYVDVKSKDLKVGKVNAPFFYLKDAGVFVMAFDFGTHTTTISPKTAAASLVKAYADAIWEEQNKISKNTPGEYIDLVHFAGELAGDEFISSKLGTFSRYDDKQGVISFDLPLPPKNWK